jgi:hypothetical protein
MKYLKSFNERLNPATYSRAAKKLRDKGHAGRADQLVSWGDKIRKDKYIEDWKKNIEEYSPFGTFKMVIKNKDKSVEGDFYMQIVFDIDCFEDVYHNRDNNKIFFSFLTNIIPSTDELLKKCKEVSNDFFGSYTSYTSYSVFINSELNDSGIIRFTGFEIDFDGHPTEIFFSDRASAGRFKSLLKRILTRPELNYPSGYTTDPNFYSNMQNVVSIKSGLSSDYGFSLEGLADYINTISVNDMYKSLN